MHAEIRDVWMQLRELGLYSVARAVYDVTFNEMMRPRVHTMAVIDAAHGAELLVKARIAEAHPLLIFNKLPRQRVDEPSVTLDLLFDEGRTHGYHDLPGALWAVRGEVVPQVETYLEFGKLRNGLVHFGVAARHDPVDEVLRFAFKVVEPMVSQFWGLSLVPFAEEYDDVIHADGYLNEQLVRLGLPAIPAHPDSRQGNHPERM